MLGKNRYSRAPTARVIGCKNRSRARSPAVNFLTPASEETVEAVKYPASDSVDALESAREQCEQRYRGFIRALETLSKEAPEQCRLMDDFNVAWELKADVVAGDYLLESSSARLTAEQQEGLRTLMGELNALPVEVMNHPNTSAGNLEAMGHPAWRSLRQRALQLAATLAPVTRANEQYFGEGHGT